jgi:hypothetical protein
MWTYLKHDDENCLLDGEQRKLPPRNTVFLAFDTFRWKVQLGVRESGGYMSLLLPAINDDCSVVAWAPIGENNDPDETIIRQHCAKTWHQAINANYARNGLKLLRGSQRISPRSHITTRRP